MTINRFGHVGMTVSDLDRSRDFYHELFGFEEFFRVIRRQPWVGGQVGYEGAVIEYLHMRGSGMHIELLNYKMPHSLEPLPDDTFRPGNMHFNLWVEDLEDMTLKIAAYLKKMPNKGLARFAPMPLDLPATMIDTGPQKGGFGYYMRDPDGHTIELWQPASVADAMAFGK